MIHRRLFLTAAAAAILLPGTVKAQGAASGIRSLLVTATRQATRRLGQRDGFFGDRLVRIPLPGVLNTAQQRLQPVGLSGPLDDLELRMNRAAEAVMPQARDLVINAIRSMTISAGLNIVRGGDTAATQYLRGQTETALTGLLRSPMETTLAASGAYGALDSAAGLVDSQSGIGQLFGRGRNARSTARDFRGEVTDFAVEKALNGVFHYVGEEERGLRSDPAGRSRDILRGLFGQ